MRIDRPFYRIIRPGVFVEYCEDRRYAEDRIMLCRAFKLLEDDLKRLFEYVEPCDENFNTYSHRIYELLLKASTEFETNAKQILKSNGYNFSGRNLNITDYFKINAATKLSEYEVFLDFWRPTRKVIMPFSEWNGQNQSLSWYQGYNKVKHDRQYNFCEASLQNVIKAIAGVLVILYAQFDFHALTVYSLGSPIFTDNDGFGTPIVESMFGIKRPNSWTEEEKYSFEWNSLKNEQYPFQTYSF